MFSSTRTTRSLARLALLAAMLAIVLAQSTAAQEPQAPAQSDAVAPAGEPLAQQPPPANDGTIPVHSLLSIMRKGGIIMYPILFCSVLTLVFIFERLIMLRRGRVIPKPFVKRFFHQLREGELDREQALELCEENKSSVARVFAGAVRKWGRPSVEVEQALIDAGERASNGLRRHLRVFNAVATVSPLLGLLGTVFGMISSFNDISTKTAMGNPQALANGISEALLTTAAGLCVAIPAMICYWVFVSRVDQLIVAIDALGEELVSLISGDSADAVPAKATRTRRRETAA